MSETVNVNFKPDANVKKAMEQVCAEMVKESANLNLLKKIFPDFGAGV